MTILCRLGLHRWARHLTIHNGRYQVNCRRCGKGLT